MKLRSRVSQAIIAVACASAAAVLGLGVGSAVGASPGTPEGPYSATAPSYDKNDSGQTYGSAARATSPETEPELIQVEATNGRTGYVEKAALDAASGAEAATTFKSPEEALRWQEAQRSVGPVTLPVYTSDGVTVIGEFVTGVAYQPTEPE